MTRKANLTNTLECSKTSPLELASCKNHRSGDSAAIFHLILLVVKMKKLATPLHSRDYPVAGGIGVAWRGMAVVNRFHKLRIACCSGFNQLGGEQVRFHGEIVGAVEVPGGEGSL